MYHDWGIFVDEKFLIFRVRSLKATTGHYLHITLLELTVGQYFLMDNYVV